MKHLYRFNRQLWYFTNRSIIKFAIFHLLMIICKQEYIRTRSINIIYNAIYTAMLLYLSTHNPAFVFTLTGGTFSLWNLLSPMQLNYCRIQNIFVRDKYRHWAVYRNTTRVFAIFSNFDKLTWESLSGNEFIEWQILSFLSSIRNI